MKVDTLIGPNLSYQVAVLEKLEDLHINDGVCYFGAEDEWVCAFDYADPATFQPIAERERIDVRWIEEGLWRAATKNKKPVSDNERYSPTVSAWGDTEAEARMRCYVKSYLGDDTKE